jgi:hypothetical protein
MLEMLGASAPKPCKSSPIHFGGRAGAPRRSDDQNRLPSIYSYHEHVVAGDC